VSFRQRVLQFQTEKIAPRSLCGTRWGSLCRWRQASRIGALNVSSSDSHDLYVQRARRMLAASVLVGLAAFAGAQNGLRAHLRFSWGRTPVLRPASTPACSC
jgi:hypothetical protein